MTQMLRHAKNVPNLRLRDNSVEAFLFSSEPVFSLELKTRTMEPRFNEPLFNEVLDITNDIISMSRPKLQ